jgi:UDP-glucose 4-epimerase
MKPVLVTGGTGYIGSHCCVALIAAGYHPIVFDNLSNSRLSVVDRIEAVSGHRPTFLQGDVRDVKAVEQAFSSRDVGSVMHFAGLKSANESTGKPIEYFDVNVSGTINVLSAMKKFAVKTIVFSSSATVYGNADIVPIGEEARRQPTHPYGQSKMIAEDILETVATSGGWSVARLRYFNPIGAHPSGVLGEDPMALPNNLMPFVAQVAAGRLKCLHVFGDDYPTRDGTGLRDYIHVCDLAEGHLAAIDYLERQGGLLTVNLGTGLGYTVKELIAEFARASGREIPYTVVGRRPGDAAASYADPSLAQRLLGWSAKRSLLEMCSDTWRWQSQNPVGYPAGSLPHYSSDTGKVSGLLLSNAVGAASADPGMAGP